MDHDPWETDEHDEDSRSGWIWIPRAAFVLYLTWVFIKSVGKTWPQTLFSAIDLGIHEAGHLLFRPFGTFMMVAGGTILQLLAPIATGILFLRRRDRFGACFAAAWVGINLVEVSVYVGDARAQVLPLVTVGGGDAMHDWAYMLGRMGCIQHGTKIAAMFRAAGFILHAAAILAAAWVTIRVPATRIVHEGEPKITDPAKTKFISTVSACVVRDGVSGRAKRPSAR